MIGLEDRQSLSQEIGAAHTAGARLHLACEIAGIDVRTLQRWRAHAGLTAGDGRPAAVRPPPGHALSQAERAELVRVANEPRFAAVPPARIVPMLADDGVYLASESTFSRVLRDEGQAVHRGRAKKPRAVRPPTTHVATAPRQVWCWDIKIHELAINPVVYAELSLSFSTFESLDRVVATLELTLREIPRPALFLAGKAYLQYRRRGGSKAQVLPDFFIGAHAAVEGWALLTRDASRFRTYFPSLEVVAP